MNMTHKFENLWKPPHELANIVSFKDSQKLIHAKILDFKDLRKLIPTKALNFKLAKIYLN